MFVLTPCAVPNNDCIADTPILPVIERVQQELRSWGVDADRIEGLVGNAMNALRMKDYITIKPEHYDEAGNLVEMTVAVNECYLVS